MPKCPNCAGNYSSNVCPYCGTTFTSPETSSQSIPQTSSQEDSQQKKKKFILIACTYIVYFFNRIFYPPAKVMLIIWTFTCSTLIFSGKMNPFEYFPVIIFGYIFYCVIANIIYASKKWRLEKYKQKITNKRDLRLELISFEN